MVRLEAIEKNMADLPSNTETTPLGTERRLIEQARREARAEPKEPLPQSIGPYAIIQFPREMLESLVRLSEYWDAAEPGKGYAEKAAEWRALNAPRTPPAQTPSE